MDNKTAKILKALVRDFNINRVVSGKRKIKAISSKPLSRRDLREFSYKVDHATAFRSIHLSERNNWNQTYAGEL